MVLWDKEKRKVIDVAVPNTHVMMEVIA